MVGLHIFVWVAMSRKVFWYFTMTAPAYIVGFGLFPTVSKQFDEEGTQMMLLSTIVALLPTLGHLIITGLPLPEVWPSSSVPVFMWSGKQWKFQNVAFRSGRTRVVMATKADTPGEEAVVGAKVVSCSIYSASNRQISNSEALVYDMDDKIIGEGNLPAGLEWVTLAWLSSANARDADKVSTEYQNFVDGLEAFLQSQHVLETKTGRPLVRAFIVEVDGKVGIDRKVEGENGFVVSKVLYPVHDKYEPPKL
eukprot:gnl/MRDRNA2_/MRDRNA2_65389_c0_seq2.p1 gnl/MRDRNA2_/MRDRNA2_65389_c0~~gnl/MRDRNA2_/MRDRNA2_65389_c0_seq2.p1  ORF type:complete len:274 (-),score=34.46 gnl/MRDRNA2_/MRDRNA2_65389_c0_seq2:24-776(-)